MNVLVTGSNGFVGRRLVALLRSCGHRVTGMGRARLPASSVDEYVTHDLSQSLPLAQPPEAVVHAAALSSPWASPDAYWKNNVEATRNVVAYCEKNTVPHLVYISSSSVYYRSMDQFKITEETPIPTDEEQINDYSRTKRIGEKLVRRFRGRWCILRPRAVFGPGDTVLFPRLLRAARRGVLPLIKRPDGQPVIGDLLYIDTLAEYIRRALERRVSGEINLTNGQPIDVHAFLFDLLQRVDCPLPHRQVSVRMAMLFAHIAERWSAWFQNYKEPALTRFGVTVFSTSKTFDTTKGERLLGPPWVSVEEGRDAFVSWWKSQQNE